TRPHTRDHRRHRARRVQPDRGLRPHDAGRRAQPRRDTGGVKTMHASIWRFTGDPDELLQAYDAMLADIPPASMRLHLCLRAPDGIVIVDTCPSHEVFEQFAAGPFPALRSRHGLPEPEDVQDGPVHAAFIDGTGTRDP